MFPKKGIGVGPGGNFLTRPRKLSMQVVRIPRTRATHVTGSQSLAVNSSTSAMISALGTSGKRNYVSTGLPSFERALHNGDQGQCEKERRDTEKEYLRNDFSNSSFSGLRSVILVGVVRNLSTVIFDLVSLSTVCKGAYRSGAQ